MPPVQAIIDWIKQKRISVPAAMSPNNLLGLLLKALKRRDNDSRNQNHSFKYHLMMWYKET
jgi:hypothetical protein